MNSTKKLVRSQGKAMNLITRIVTALCVVTALSAAAAHAQFGPRMPQPNFPQPNFPQPNFPRPPVVSTPNMHPPTPAAPQMPVVIKRCSRCGHEVPSYSSDGMVCPYCGVTWGQRSGGSIVSRRLPATSQDSASSDAVESPRGGGVGGAGMIVVYGLGTAGLALIGAAVAVWYLQR
jgi:hypothetical protein